MGVWLSFFYKFAENREFLIGRFLPYKLGIETPAALGPFLIRTLGKSQSQAGSANLHSNDLFLLKTILCSKIRL